MTSTAQHYLLDTHVWLWFAAGDTTLKPKIRELIELGIHNNLLHVASISFWEISMLASKKRIILSQPTLEWIKQSLDALRLQTVDLTPAIAVDSSELPGNFHGDPADRLIVASARADNLILLSRDTNIINYSKKKYLDAMKV